MDRSRKRESDETSFKPKEFTIRIQLIPVGSTVQSVKNDLESLRSSLSDPLNGALDSAKIRSLYPADKNHCSATVVLTSPKPVEELVSFLNQASEDADLNYEFDCAFYGITPLSEDSSGVDCDIVAVPGLNSNPVGSWRAPQNNKLWLRDWLPKDIPRIRVLIYGYDTNLVKSQSYESIENLSQRFLESLATFRQDTNTKGRPIILLGHSLGGLLVKEALVGSSKSQDWRPYQQEIHKLCCGIVFFGVPHDGIRRKELEDIVRGQPNFSLVNSIVPDSQGEPSSYLKRLSADFAQCFHGYFETRVVSFFELVPTKPVVKKDDGTLVQEGEARILVTQTSATKTGLTGHLFEDNVSVDSDHGHLTRFRSMADPHYKITKNRILDMVSLEPLRQAEERMQDTSGPVEEPEEPKLLPYHTTISQGGSTISGVNVQGDSNNVNLGNQAHQNFGRY